MGSHGLLVVCGYSTGSAKAASCGKQAQTFFRKHNIADVTILADDGYHSPPTKSSVLISIRGVVERAFPGDQVYLFIVGCGNELNGGFLPSDYRTAGTISRTEFRACIEHLDRSTVLFILSDLSGAGSVIDLPFKLTAERHPANSQMLLRLDSATALSDDIIINCISCVKGSNVPEIGSLLTAFIACVNLNPAPQCQQLLADIWHALSQTCGPGGPMPRLSSTKSFNADEILNLLPTRVPPLVTPANTPTKHMSGATDTSLPPNPLLAETLQALQGMWFTSANTRVEVVSTKVHYVDTGHIFDLKLHGSAVELVGSKLLGNPSGEAFRVVWDDGDVWAKQGSSIPVIPDADHELVTHNPATPLDHYSQYSAPRSERRNINTPVTGSGQSYGTLQTNARIKYERPSVDLVPRATDDPHVSPQRHTPAAYRSESAVRAYRDGHSNAQEVLKEKLEAEKRAALRDAEQRQLDGERGLEQRDRERREAERGRQLRERERREAEEEARRRVQETEYERQRVEQNEQATQEMASARRRQPIYPENLIPLLQSRADRAVQSRSWSKWVYFLILSKQFRRIESIGKALEIGSVGTLLARYVHKWRLWLVLRRPTTLPYRFRPVKSSRDVAPPRIAVWLQKAFLARQSSGTPDESIFDALRSITSDNWPEVQSEYETKYSSDLLDMFQQYLSVPELERGSAILLSNGVQVDLAPSSVDV